MKSYWKLILYIVEWTDVFYCTCYDSRTICIPMFFVLLDGSDKRSCCKTMCTRECAHTSASIIIEQTGTPLWAAAVFYKSRAFTGDSPRHVFFFFFFYFVSTAPNANKSILWRRDRRICFAVGCSALFAVLSWHFESVSDFIDYPGKCFPRPFATRRPTFSASPCCV